MKSVLISIQPKWCQKIISGEKTVEIRKSRPKIQTPFKCYIYCTKPKELFDLSYDVKFGKVIGEFVCDWIESTPLWRLKGNTGFLAKRTQREEKLPQMACLSLDEIYRYILNENKLIYGWHIKDLVIYNEPKELGEFYKECEKAECEDCPYLHFENTPNSYEGWCEFNEKIPIKRPPQSWCYVEDITAY
jgi:predicted transcriptional regulator